MRVRLSHLLLALTSTAAAAALFSPAFFRPQATGFGDWQFFHHMWEAGYVALLRHGEWPLWDPYHCGGITIFGNPQSQHLSPLYLLALLAGPTLGSKLFVVVHAAVGFAGMYELARARSITGPGAVLAALAWCASGFFVSHASGGHSAFLPFYFAPYLLLAWQKAAVQPGQVLVVVALLVLTLLEGGVYPFPYFVLLLAFDATLRLLLREHSRGVIVSGLVSVVLVASCAAIRLWPIVDELRRSPRAMPSTDGVSVREVLEMLTARRHGWRYAGHGFVWPEYVTYVGFGVLALALVGLVVALLRGQKRLVVGLGVFLWLMMGDHGALSAWSWVHRLPIYDSLRVPSRFAVFFTLYLALLAGLGLDAVCAIVAHGAKPWLARSIGLTVCALIAGDFAIVHYPTLNRWLEPPVITDRVSGHFYLSQLNYGRHYASLPRMNLGSRSCYEAMNFVPARGLWNGDVPQVRVVKGSGTLVSFQRTSHTVQLVLQMQTAGRALLNQNHAPGWQSDVGAIVEDAGKLALELPAGEQRVTLRYVPTTLTVSSVTSLLGLVLCGVYFAWTRRRYGQRMYTRL